MRMILEINTNEPKEVLEALAIVTSLITGTPSVTETVVEAPKEAKPTKTLPKTKKKPEDVPTQEAEETKPTGITLEVLKDRAKQKAQSAGREKVKAVIAKYAPKLSEVSKEDFGSCYKALGLL